MYIYSNSKNQKHKVFISFYHHDDEWYKNELERLFSDKMISKSVQDGEYDSDDSDEYVKRLIREDKISDSSVVVVLCGPNTRRRKHVDWEIYAGLRKSVNGTSGLVGVLLPEFPISQDNQYNYSDIPGRLADNVESEYANVYTWAYFKENFVSIIQVAFDNRIKLADRVNNSRIQMKRNL